MGPTRFGNGLELVQQLNSGHSLITGTNCWFLKPNQVQDAHILECQLAHCHVKSCERDVRTTAEGSLRSSKPPPCMWSLGKAWSPPSSIVGQRHPYQEAAASQGTRPPGEKDHQYLQPGKPRKLENSKHTFQALNSLMISIGGKSSYSTNSARATAISTFTPTSAAVPGVEDLLNKSDASSKYGHPPNG